MNILGSLVAILCGAVAGVLIAKLIKREKFNSLSFGEGQTLKKLKENIEIEKRVDKCDRE